MTASHRTVLIIEGGSTGHLLVYVRVLASFALDRGDSVIVALSASAFESMEYGTHLQELGDRVAFVKLPERLTPRAIDDLALEVQADRIVIPHADPIVGALALRWRRRASADLRLLIMRDPRWERPATAKRRIKAMIKLLLSRRLERSVGTTVLWLREPQHAPTGKEQVAVDPFIADGTWAEIEDGSGGIRTKLNEVAAVFWFGVTGAISAHKNLPLILQAMEQLRAMSPDAAFGLAVIGPISPQSGVSEQMIRERCGDIGIPCYVDDRLLTNFEMNSVIAALEAVLMVYSTHSPNSTLGKAYVLGTRLIAAGPPSIRGFVRALDAGWESDVSGGAITLNLARALVSNPPDSHHGAASSNDFARSVLGYGTSRGAEADPS